MSLYNEIFRIKNLRYAIRDKLISMGLLEEPVIYEPGQEERIIYGEDLQACKDAIYSIDGSINITTTKRINVSNKKTAKIIDSNLKPGNIRKNVTILGVTGTFQGTNSSLPLYPKYWIYDTSVAPPSIEIPPSDYDGYDIVQTGKINGDQVLVENNIVKRKKIMGVDGQYDANMMPHFDGNSHSFWSEWNPKTQQYDVYHYSLIGNKNIVFRLENYNINDNRIILNGTIHRRNGWTNHFNNRDSWSPPDNNYYYIYKIYFGEKIYDNNNFLSMDVYKRNDDNKNFYYHVRMVDNTPYSVTQWTDSSSSFPALYINLANKQFKLANSHEEYVGDVLNWSNMIQFDTNFNYVKNKYYELSMVTT